MKILSWGKETGIGVEHDPRGDLCSKPLRRFSSHKHGSHGACWHLRLFSLLFWFAP